VLQYASQTGTDLIFFSRAADLPIQEKNQRIASKVRCRFSNSIHDDGLRCFRAEDIHQPARVNDQLLQQAFVVDGLDARRAHSSVATYKAGEEEFFRRRSAKKRQLARFMSEGQAGQQFFGSGQRSKYMAVSTEREQKT
jgi:hypothetical protein